MSTIMALLGIILSSSGPLSEEVADWDVLRRSLSTGQVLGGWRLNTYLGNSEMNAEAGFFRRCKELAGDTSGVEWTEDHLAGFFQRFRPDGIGLESLFQDIPGGTEVFSRLLQVYRATIAPPREDGSEDGYFIVRQPQCMLEKDLVQAASDQLHNWSLMAAAMDEQELSRILGSNPPVAVSRGEAPERDPIDTESLDVWIGDVESDWFFTLTPICPHSSWMSEAFYFLACDYSLARYVTWPWYRDASTLIEPYQPYFHRWLAGVQLRCLSSESITLYTGPGTTQKNPER